MAANHSITNKTVRSKLKPNREPYWHRITRGRFVGYRKLKAGGTWIARFKSSRKSLGSDGGIDFDEALRRTNEYCDQMDAGVEIACTIRQAIDQYCDDFATRKNTKDAEKYRKRLNNILPDSIKDTPVHKLTTLQLTQWRTARIVQLDENPTEDDLERQRRSKCTNKREFSQIKAMLNFTVAQGIVDSDSAWKRIKNFGEDVEKARSIFLTDEEIGAILNAAKEPYKTYYRACLLLGSRPGEPADLQVKDFDAKERTIFYGRKTAKRTTHLSDAAYELIKENIKSKLPNALIFPNHHGEKWQDYELVNAFKKLRRELKLPESVVMYCFRHYFISRCLESDMDILAVARNCGTSIERIEKNYGHFRKGKITDMLNKVNIPA